MVSDMNICVWKLSKITAQKKVFFFTFFTFEVPFNGLFAPTSRSWMSNIFRDLESLGKSYEKKWSKIAAQKKVFFCWFCLTKHGGNHASRWINRGFGYSWSTLLWHQCYYPHRSRDALSPVCRIFYVSFHVKNNAILNKIMGFTVILPTFNSIYTLNHLFYTRLRLMT